MEKQQIILIITGFIVFFVVIGIYSGIKKMKEINEKVGGFFETLKRHNGFSEIDQEDPRYLQVKKAVIASFPMERRAGIRIKRLITSEIDGIPFFISDMTSFSKSRSGRTRSFFHLFIKKELNLNAKIYISKKLPGFLSGIINRLLGNPVELPHALPEFNNNFDLRITNGKVEPAVIDQGFQRIIAKRKDGYPFYVTSSGGTSMVGNVIVNKDGILVLGPMVWNENGLNHLFSMGREIIHDSQIIPNLSGSEVVSPESGDNSSDGHETGQMYQIDI